jgi:DNA polymerase III sliding clamp (beta) subunit (PCNA family)
LTTKENDEEYLKPVFLPTDVRFAFSGKTKKISDMVARLSAISSIDSLYPGSDLIRIDAIPPKDGKVAYVRMRTFNGQASIMSVTDRIQFHFEGTVFVPADKLNSVLQLASGEDVKLVSVGFELQVSSGNSLWRIQLPSRPGAFKNYITEDDGIRLDAHELYAALSGVVKASAKGLARMSLTQVHVHHGSMVACDGQRLHRSQIPSLQEFPSFTIPTYGAMLFLKSLKVVASSDKVLLKVDDTSVTLLTSTDIISVLRNKLEYPDVEKLFISQSVINDTSVTLNKDDLFEAVKSVKLFADELLSSVLIYEEDENTIIVQAEDELGNSSQVKLEGKVLGKANIRLSLNYRNLLDVLDSMSSDLITLRSTMNSKTSKASALFEDTLTGFIGILSQVIKEN